VSARDAPELISVIIPVRNAAATLGEQLAALAGQHYEGDWEVVVVDNGSDDDTATIAYSFADRLPKLRVVEAPGGGASGARNAGAAAAHGDLLAYCDGDDVAAEDWLAGLAAAAPEGGLIGGRLDDRSLNDEVIRSWRPPQQIGGELARPCGFLPAVASANLAIWADVLREVGCWREDYVGGHEDTELCWRAQLAGHRLVFAPDAVMKYRYRAGLRPLARQSFRYGLLSAKLYREHRADGMPRSSWRVAAGAWLRTVRELPKLRDPVGRGRWVRRVSFHSGRLAGSIRFRVLFL